MPLNPLFCFRYGEQDFSLSASGAQTLPDGISVRCNLREFPEGGLYMQPELANCGSQTSLPLSRLRASCFLPLTGQVQLYTTRGTWGPDMEKDFFIESQPLIGPKELSCDHGRSSEGLMPYFDLNAGGGGVLAAVGWSGQWSVSLLPMEGGVTVEAGLPEADFVLYPGEQVTLPSLLLLPYEKGQAQAHNAFRRIIKNHFSPLGKGERPKTMPISLNHWGFVPSETLCGYAKSYAGAGIQADVFWVDAGWFGTPDLANEASWIGHAGNWQEDGRTHPDRFREVSRTVRENGMGFLLWYEPERCCSVHEAALRHPDWFLPIREDAGQPLRTYLVNLGNRGGYQFVFDLLDTDITGIGLDWLRIDFNIHPLEHWRQNDAPGRKGLTEIFYVNGLYKLLSALLERHPRLMIDNCASGGSRLDLEMMKYSVPLWRSDFQCDPVCNPNANQSQLMGGAWWLPYQSAGMGKRLEDTYHLRSSYSGGGGQDFIMNLRECSGAEWDRRLAAIAAGNREYRALREYFYQDYYPLTPQSTDPTTWAAWQFFNPETEEGLVQVFRREKSPQTEAELCLGGLEQAATYRLTDMDSGLATDYSGKELTAGWRVRMDTPRLAKIWLLKKI